MAHVFEVPGSRDLLGVREDTVMEDLTPVNGCQLADFPKTILPEMLTNDRMDGIYIQVNHLHLQLSLITEKQGNTLRTTFFA